MQGMVPLYGFGGGGSGTVLTVMAPAGSTVTDSSGMAVFSGLKTDAWTITTTGGDA